jgi:hypothetical protein
MLRAAQQLRKAKAFFAHLVSSFDCASKLVFLWGSVDDEDDW